MMVNRKFVCILFINLVLGIFIGYFLIPSAFSYQSNCVLFTMAKKNLPKQSLKISSNVQIINANEPINTNFQCIKGKKLLNYISTTVCLHNASTDIFVSGSFKDETSIYDESGVVHILQLLIRNPHLDFIDIGANIGTYTMYAAALGRFVLAIDCFAPNLERLHRAIQLTNVANRVVLIQNAIYSHSGQFLRLSNDAKNIGGQAIETSTNKTYKQSAINDPYIVKTIEFDDLLPILISRGIRGAIMKIDIESSESFVMESGSQIFDSLEIPFIQMEWKHVRFYPERVKIIFDFFAKRNYDPITFSYKLLNPTENSAWPNEIYWIKRNVWTFC